LRADPVRDAYLSALRAAVSVTSGSDEPAPAPVLLSMSRRRGA